MLDVLINCHSSIKIENFYFDPYRIEEAVHDASIVFITHSHYDHFSPEDVKAVSNADTKFVVTPDCVSGLVAAGVAPSKITTVKPGASLSVNGVRIETFSAFNENKPFHPRSKNWVGYVVTIGKKRCCVIGDGDLHEDLVKIKCDYLFVPIGGTYTMDAAQAAQLANLIAPELTIPTHYGTLVGGKEDENAFIARIKVPYRILIKNPKNDSNG